MHHVQYKERYRAGDDHNGDGISAARYLTNHFHSFRSATVADRDGGDVNWGKNHSRRFKFWRLNQSLRMEIYIVGGSITLIWKHCGDSFLKIDAWKDMDMISIWKMFPPPVWSLAEWVT